MAAAYGNKPSLMSLTVKKMRSREPKPFLPNLWAFSEYRLSF
jgi:hypothetical protein